MLNVEMSRCMAIAKEMSIVRCRKKGVVRKVSI